MSMRTRVDRLEFQLDAGVPALRLENGVKWRCADMLRAVTEFMELSAAGAAKGKPAAYAESKFAHLWPMFAQLEPGQGEFWDRMRAAFANFHPDPKRRGNHGAA